MRKWCWLVDKIYAAPGLYVCVFVCWCAPLPSHSHHFARITPHCRPPDGAAHRSSPWSTPCCTVRTYWSTSGTRGSWDRLADRQSRKADWCRRWWSACSGCGASGAPRRSCRRPPCTRWPTRSRCRCASAAAGWAGWEGWCATWRVKLRGGWRPGQNGAGARVIRLDSMVATTLMCGYVVCWCTHTHTQHLFRELATQVEINLRLNWAVVVVSGRSFAGWFCSG